MKDMRKIMGTLIGILGFIAAMAGLTYAMYSGNVSDNNITGGHDCEEIISYREGTEVSGVGLKEVNDYTEGSVQTEITFYASCGISEGTIYINTSTATSANLLNNMLKYTIIKNSSTPVTYTGDITKTGDTAINVGKLETTETTYTVHIWIKDNGNSDANGTFSGYVHASAKQTSTFIDEESTENETGAMQLINKYNAATKTPVTTQGGESITQVADLGMMQDSFGNIRYYGEDPDNYVTFNGETAGWRIIGVFDVEDENGKTEKRIKLIRAASIDSLAFDNKPSGVGTSTSTYGSNNWTDARLMMLLNPGYEEPSALYAYEGSLYWNSGSGTCYAGQSSGTKTCNFTSTGLTDEGKNLISKTKYYLGGSSSNSGLYADDYYNFERADASKNWIGYVGIMYPSDYVYATDLSVCKKDGYNYDTDTTNCKGKDWLLDTSYTTWTISPHSSHAYYAFYVYSSGCVAGNRVGNAFGVRPVLYLKSDVSIVSGEGTTEKPYVLG